MGNWAQFYPLRTVQGDFFKKCEFTTENSENCTLKQLLKSKKKFSKSLRFLAEEKSWLLWWGCCDDTVR